VSYAGGATTITPNWTGGTEDVELDESNAVSGPLSILRKAGTAGTVENPKWTLGVSKQWAAFGLIIRDSGTTPTTGVKITQSALVAKSASTRDLPLPAPTTAGCAILLVLAVVAVDSSTLAAATVTDNNSGSYTAIVDLNFGVSNRARLAAYLAANLGGRSGHVVTVTYSKSVYIAAKVYELNGVPTASLISGTTATNTGTGTAVTGGSVTPADTGLHFGGMHYDGSGILLPPIGPGRLRTLNLMRLTLLSDR
jgi:hypothetical protein